MITASARRPAARWVVTCTLTNTTALRVGGGDGDIVDSLVRRDRLQPERPLIPGSTLAGLLRSHLSDRLAGFNEPEPPDVASLFGASRGNDDPQYSMLIVADALGCPSVAEVRDGVKIAAETGTASDHFKFDYEVIPAGCTFECAFELTVRAPKAEEPSHEPHLLGLFAQAAGALDDGINIGGKATRGLGHVQATNWKATRFDLSSADGWNQWLCHDPIESDRTGTATSVLDAIRSTGFQPAHIKPPAWSRIVIDIKLLAIDETLVRSPGTGADTPDQRMLLSGGLPTHPGTSFAGALRARARRIAEVAGQSELVEKLFGPEPNGKLRASPLRVSESSLTGSAFVRVDRVRIERLTHGTVPGALFDEEVVEGGTAQVRIELRQPQAATTGLLLACVKDLITGELPTGGTTGIGRGRWLGDCTLIATDGTIHSFSGRPGAQEPETSTLAWLDEQLEAMFARDT